MRIPMMRKRQSVFHRALEMPINGIDMMHAPIAAQSDKNTLSSGVGLKVDLTALIKSVWVSPSTDSWFEDVVKREVFQYGLKHVSVLRDHFH